MNKNNIIFVRHEPLTKHIRKIFYINEFIAVGYHVEYWDVSQYCYSSMNLIEESNDNFICKIRSTDDLENALLHINIQKTIFIIDFDSKWSNRHLFKILKQNKCYTISVRLFDNSIIKLGIVDKLKFICLDRFDYLIKKLFQYIIYWLYSILFCKFSYKKVFSSSSLITQEFNKINHPDYEAYLKLQSSQNLLMGNGEKFIVFLDVYFPLHPDLKTLKGISLNKLSANKYYDDLNSLFSDLEKKLGMPVVIAAHPKANYRGDEFNGRQIKKGQTAELVCNSQVVISHWSNSISYAILADKPILFIRMTYFNFVPKLDFFQKKLSEVLGSTVYTINIKGAFEKIEIKKILPELRRSYIYTYLTGKNICDKSNIEILLNEFEKI